MRMPVRRVWRALRASSLLALCAGSLCATVYAESRGADLWDAVGASRAASAPVVQPAPVRTTPQDATVDGADEVAAIPSGVQAPDGVLVPHFEGERLSAALRLAEQSGLAIAATDEWGDRIRASEASYYRVRKQRTEPGALVDEGATVKLSVRAFGAAMGY